VQQTGPLRDIELLPHPVLATSSVADERIRVLKHGDTFAVLDHYGGIKPGGLGEHGLYHDGTRFLSRWQIELEGHRLFHLGSTARGDNGQLAVVLTNPDVIENGDLRMPLGTLHIGVRTFLWQAVLYQQLRVKNYGPEAVDGRLVLHFGSDFADIYEVRGKSRDARGTDLAPELGEFRVTLGYQGLDGLTRRTVIQVGKRPSRLDASTAVLRLTLGSREETEFFLTVACESGSERTQVLGQDEARLETQRNVEKYRAWSCHLSTSSDAVNAWIERAEADLQMMTTELPTGPYPYAGVPWFNTPFGRDGIITALECLWLRPGLARGVLSYLASTQAEDLVPEQDAEPGKILHETRNGEMARLGEMPFGRYYGGVDTTPLFILLAGAYIERSDDRAFGESLWPHIDRALCWIDNFGDRDGDGFIEYQRQAADGLLHQGWKDSDDAIFHADGSMPQGPIALCEVQGYVYAARRAAANLAAMLGFVERAAELTRQAEALQQRFEEAFWCEELSTYSVALDGAKVPCRVRTSNAGHCLFAGIARADRAFHAARTLMSPNSFSGWGVRTVAESELRYNPMGYHTGSVWPHDNALIAQGFSRYGFQDRARQILTGIFEAATQFDLHRMPELFCGFSRDPNEGPILYPVACAPQAWAAASVFLLFQACLGIEISAAEKHVYFNNPQLPLAVSELRIHNLAIGAGMVDLLVVHREDDLSVEVLRREGDVQVLITK
jgi:glycogen debranching enzyme